MIDSKTPPASGEFNLLGDMTILREIIIGPQIVSNNTRFSEMQADLAKKNDEFEKRLVAVEKSFESQLKKMEASIQQQLTEMRENTENAYSQS